MRIANFCPACDSAELTHNSAVLMPFVANRVFGWQPADIKGAWGLQSISPGKAYAVCNTLTCQYCGMLFLDMRFDADEMLNLYAGYRGKEYTALREKYEPGYTARNVELIKENHIPQVEALINAQPKTVLDFGGGDGSKTPYASAWCSVYDIANAEQPTLLQSYDLIVCAHVLEHVSQPFDILTSIKNYMTPNSLLYIELPYDLASAPLPKRHWHEHINFFTPEALSRLLHRSGMNIIKMEQRIITGTTPYFMILCKASE